MCCQRPRPDESSPQGHRTAYLRPRCPRKRHLGPLHPPSRPDICGNWYNDLPTWTRVPRRGHPERPALIHIGRAPRRCATTCAEGRAGVLHRAAAALRVMRGAGIAVPGPAGVARPSTPALPSPAYQSHTLAHLGLRPYASMSTDQRTSRAHSATCDPCPRTCSTSTRFIGARSCTRPPPDALAGTRQRRKVVQVIQRASAGLKPSRPGLPLGQGQRPRDADLP